MTHDEKTTLQSVAQHVSTAVEAFKSQGIPERKIYTVVGYWESAGRAFAEPVLGVDAHDAIRACAEEYGEGSDDCCIVAAISSEGDMMATFPCEDSEGTAYACDLVSGDDFEFPVDDDEDEPPTLRECL